MVALDVKRFSEAGSKHSNGKTINVAQVGINKKDFDERDALFSAVIRPPNQDSIF